MFKKDKNSYEKSEGISTLSRADRGYHSNGQSGQLRENCRIPSSQSARVYLLGSRVHVEFLFVKLLTVSSGLDLSSLTRDPFTYPYPLPSRTASKNIE